MSEELDAHIEVADAANQFAASKLGRKMLETAQEDLDVALDEFERADVTDHAKMMEIQNKVRLGRRIPRWLGEIVMRAEEEINARKRHTD